MTTPPDRPPLDESNADDAVVARLAELRDATADIGAPSGLSARVLDALAAEERASRSVWEQASRSSGGVALVALLAAAAAVTLAVWDDGHLAKSVASADDVGVASSTGDP